MIEFPKIRATASAKWIRSHCIRTAKVFARHDRSSIDQEAPVAKKPCKHCPYRKDKVNWLQEDTTLQNVTAIHYGEVQMCHMAQYTHKCAGAAACLAGGNEQIVSPSELGTREFAADPRIAYTQGDSNE